MASNYDEIRRVNIKCYGTDIGRIGPMLLANRYDDRTHFIFELLQNAEDALHRRQTSGASQAVSFLLQQKALRVSHYGDPFTEKDVRGICGIDESTKEINEIGRFGIGFKSVYAFTDRPKVHSGTDDFAIEEFVRPVAVPQVQRDADETVILIPFKPSSSSAYDEICSAFRRLGASSLLFLRRINEINWRTEDSTSGQYLRDSIDIDSNVRRVTIIGEQFGKSPTNEEWLIFSQPVTADGTEVRPIEIAFSCLETPAAGGQRIRRVARSPLVVFFPTAVETHLGFLLQGPYRTTPSRDNIPRDDAWNRSLVKQTAALLRVSLSWLRDHHMLDTEVLQCLPIDSGKFGNGTMFASLFADTKDSLSTECLLPCDDGGFTAAPNARLGRTRELRRLFDATQLAALYPEEQELSWLTGTITQDRTPLLREYLMRELNVPENTPDDVVQRLNCGFLEAQTDAWILRLYEFLNGQPALRRLFKHKPIIRLEDGKHVASGTGRDQSAFLPTDTTTEFPTVRASVCASESALEFLVSLGLKEPDPVDDVIANVLPKYQDEQVKDISDSDYKADVSRILMAYRTDSQVQRKRLVSILGRSRFVRSVDASDRSLHYAEPSRLYLATDRLKALLDGVDDVLFVDDSNASLQGENMRSLLEASGAARSLHPVEVHTTFMDQQKCEMRMGAGCKNSSGGESVEDRTLRGLDGLLMLLPHLDPAARTDRVRLLWEALSDLENRLGKGIFSGTYYWKYIHKRSASFDAAFVHKLNDSRWVPDTAGNLRLPKFVPFGSLDWNKHPFLESIILFKPPELDVLARKLGIEPGMIELLREAGIETEAQLRERLGFRERPTIQPDPPSNEENEETGTTSTTAQSGESRQAIPCRTQPPIPGRTPKPRPADPNAAKFVSYVAVHAEDEEIDPDGLSHDRRMAVEELAIRLILEREPEWHRTAPNNPGYDLFRIDEHGQREFCEVKAMAGTLHDRPVGMSRTQFDHANEHGGAFWLYVVERANDDGAARIVRIQNPAGKALTFTFDSGWLAVDSQHHTYDSADGVQWPRDTTQC